MSKEIIVGRSALKRSFREFFIRSIDEGKDTRLFLPFRKQREAPLTPPWIFLFHGEECLGKSLSIDYCIGLARDTAVEFKRSLNIVSLDWDELSFTKGDIPENGIELMDTIADIFCESKSGFASNFASYRKLSENYKRNASNIDGIYRNYLLNQMVEGKSEKTDETEGTESFTLFLQKTLSQQDFDLHVNGEKKLIELFVSAVLSSAEEEPLIFSIDGYDRISSDLEMWLRREILTRIAERKTKLIMFIAGGTLLLRKFRNDFPEEALYAVNFSDITFTRRTIASFASKKHINLSEENIALIERSTAGIPFLVHDTLFHLSNGISINDLLEDTENDVRASEMLCGAILNRFFTYCNDNTVRERIFSLSMLSQFNAKLLAEIWNVPFSDVKHSIEELEKQVSFIRRRFPHPHIRRLLRSSLIQEAARGSQSVLKPFFVNFGSVTSRISRELLTQLQTAIQSAEKRCHDPRYPAAIEQLVSGIMWSSPSDALSAFSAFYIELIHFNPSAARKILSGISEFRPLFSPINEKIFKQFSQCVYMADISRILKGSSVEPIENDLISYFESVTESMTDFQRALLYHLKGTIELRKENLKEAMEQINRCFSLLGNNAPEKTILYEAYVILGYLFYRSGEYRWSIDTFSNSVLIRADGFIPWYTMGIARMALGEYEGAVNALNEAVKINPSDSEAWFKLGLSYVKIGQHNMAVESFLRATETSPERPEIWFELGSSYSVLGKHSEAANALRKVVTAQQDNAEAWMLLGHSCSACEDADEAIAAYQKAVEIKPKSLEPIKALGIEYYKLGRFDEAVDALMKATRISKKDPELWCLIAEAHLGAGRNDKAVDAGNKALAIDNKFLRAWIVIGNAQKALNNFDEAIRAFNNVVEAEPDNADIWMKLGTIYSGRKEHELAISAFKKAVAFNPDLKEVWYTIGMAYETQKQYAEALSAFEKGVRADPKNIDCWLHKGKMHNQLEQFEDAFESYSQIVLLDPSHLAAWFERGSAALNTGDFKDAVDSFVKFVELDPANAEGWFRLGKAYQGIDNHQEAVHSFTEAASHDGKRTDIWAELGASCQKLGIYEEAVAAYEKCIEIDPENPEFFTNLGTSYYSIGKFEQAYTAFKKAAELDKDNMEILFNLALTCHAQENYNEAIEYYKTITSQNSDHADAWFNLALSYHATGSYTQAIEAYSLYVKKWPENGHAWFNLALAYHAAQDMDNAILIYKEAAAVMPEDPEVWYNLGIALHAKELYGDAIQSYRKALQYMPDHINAWFNLGMAYYIWQNYIDAIDSYSNVVKRDPSHYIAWGNLAISYFAVNDYVKGFDAVKRAYEIKPDEPWILGNLIVGALFTGNRQQAQEYAEKLVAIDNSGEIIKSTIMQIRNGLRKLPQPEGFDVVIGKLQEGLQKPADNVMQSVSVPPNS